MKPLNLLFALLLCSTPLFAGNTVVDFIAMPSLPADGMVRHVQVLQQTDEGALDSTYVHVDQEMRLTSREAQHVVDSLHAWLDGINPPNNLVYQKIENSGPGASVALYYFEVDAMPSSSPRTVLLRSQALTTKGSKLFCSGTACPVSQTFQVQKLLLQEDDVAALAAALEAWVGGENPAEGLIWTKSAN